MPVTHPSVLAARTPEPCTVAIPSIPHGVPFRRAWSGVFSRARGRGPGTTVALRSGAIMRFVAPAVLCLLLASSGPASARRCGDDVDGRAVPCDCGDVLVASRTLGADDAITSRVCPGSGLLVDAPPDRAVTLTLAGHALAGSGRGFGIEVLGGSGVAIVGPGAVRGFERGLLATRGGLARLADVTAAENASDGFDLAGDGYVVSGCEALRNGRDGFALGGVRYRVEGNR